MVEGSQPRFYLSASVHSVQLAINQYGLRRGKKSLTNMDEPLVLPDSYKFEIPCSLKLQIANVALYQLAIFKVLHLEFQSIPTINFKCDEVMIICARFPTAMYARSFCNHFSSEC